jgi:cytochrome c-type biogenesis protein
MNSEVSIVAALIGGVASFLSPCVLPLVLPYLVYLAGSSLERLMDEQPDRRMRRMTIVAAVLFVAGFSTVFVALGAGSSVIGDFMRQYLDEFAIFGGVVIIGMGLHFLGVAPIALLTRQARLQAQKPVGLWGAYVMGLAFAFGWTPCIGPILAAILALAATKATLASGSMLLAVYSLGLGLPFIAAAALTQPFVAFAARFRRHLGIVERVTGGLLVMIGIAFLVGAMPNASLWLVEIFPRLGQIG